MNDTPTRSETKSFGADNVGYDPITDSFHAQFGDDLGGVTMTIVDAVGTVTDRDPATMTPLYETVDPESLSALVASAGDRPLDVTFVYENCRVTVSSDGSVVVESAE